MRISTTLALALGLAAVGACKKDKKKDDPVVVQPDKGSGSAGGMTASGSGTAPVAVKPLEGEALAKRYIECAGMINAGDMDKFASECVADSFTAHSASMGEDMVGKDKLTAMFKEMRTGFPDMKIAPQVVLVNGRNIAAVAMTTGTNSGAMNMGGMEMPKTDKKIGMLFFHRLKFDDANKTTEEWEVSDQGTMAVQLGMAPKGMTARPVMDKGMDGAPMIVVAANDEKEKTNLAAMKAGNDAFNAHKAADIMATMTDDAVESDLASEKDSVGKKEIQPGMEMFLSGFSDGKVEATEIWAAGDYVVQLARFTGTNDGKMGGAPKTGKKVDVEFAEIAQFKDGKITKLWRFRDNMSFAKQLGLMEEPPAKTDPKTEPVAKPKEK